MLDGLGFVATLPADGEDDGRFDGVTSDGERCVAMTAKLVRCPKDSAVRLMTTDPWDVAVPLCGGHYGVHRRGKLMRLVLDGD